MYLYHLSYSWYEEFSPVVFTHEQAYSEEQWKELLQKGYDAVIPGLLTPDADGFRRWVGGREIFDALVMHLYKQGFQNATYQQSHEVWGGAMPLNRDLPGLQQPDPTEGTHEFSEALPFLQSWLEKICSYNQIIEDAQHARYLKMKEEDERKQQAKEQE